MESPRPVPVFDCPVMAERGAVSRIANSLTSGGIVIYWIALQIRWAQLVCLVDFVCFEILCHNLIRLTPNQGEQ